MEEPEVKTVVKAESFPGLQVIFSYTGRVTTATVLHNDGTLIGAGSVKCFTQDEYNRKKGERMAVRKALLIGESSWIRTCEVEEAARVTYSFFRQWQRTWKYEEKDQSTPPGWNPMADLDPEASACLLMRDGTLQLREANNVTDPLKVFIIGGISGPLRWVALGWLPV